VAAFIKENTQFTDIDGEPLANGFLYIGQNKSNPVTTAASTTIFADRELQIELANPQRLNDFGESINKIWIDGKYSQQANNSNDVQKFQDLDAGETAESGITTLSNVQGTNDITAEASPTITAYVDKEIYLFTVATTNTGPVTFNIDSIGPEPLLKNNNQPLVLNDLIVDEVIAAVYNDSNTNFVLINQLAGISLGTEITTTGGTSITFTGIPAGVKQIGIMLDDVDTSGTSDIIVQIGDSGGFETSGYVGGVINQSAYEVYSGEGFDISVVTNSADSAVGIMTLRLQNAATFKWVCSSQFDLADDNTVNLGAGNKTLSAELTQIRLTTDGESDTFDAVAINIQFE